MRKDVDLILKSNHFQRRGSAYFRVQGDGVLQVVKRVRERTGWEIHFGMQSLYGELDQQWLTSMGCITKHTVNSFVDLKEVYEEQLRVNNSITALDQYDILLKYGMESFNQIQTQADLSEALCKFDLIRYKRILWNDWFKVVPFLKSENYSLALQSVMAILEQHKSADEWRRDTWDKERYLAYQKRQETLDAPIHLIYNYLQCDDYDSIRGWLSKNYEKNQKLTKFCQPEQKKRKIGHDLRRK